MWGGVQRTHPHIYPQISRFEGIHPRKSVLCVCPPEDEIRGCSNAFHVKIICGFPMKKRPQQIKGISGVKIMRTTNWLFHKTTLITVTAILSALNGLAYLFFPTFSTGILGITPDDYGLHITRYYGACALGYGLLLWLIRDNESHKVIQAALFSILIILGISVVIGITGLVAGVTNQFGLLFVITDLLLSLGSGALLIKE